MTAVAQIGGHRASGVTIHVPAQGAWYADVDCEEAPTLSGAQTLTIDAAEFRGTIDARFAGTFAERRRLRLVGGAGGWGAILLARGYHSDGGVRARLVAEDAAREAGETLAAFAPQADMLGRDFSRAAGEASVTLEWAAGGAPWWVDYDGTTHVGARPATSPADTAYEVLEHDPRSRLVTLSVDAVDAVQIGATLTERLDVPVIVRELVITVGDVIRVVAWCGGVDASRGRLLDAVRSIVRHEMRGRLWGVYRYRVGRMSTAEVPERYELQAVRRAAGVPDVIPCSAWPGVAGSHSIVALGVEVLVQFVEGDPGQPVLVAFAGKDGANWIPVEAILAASSKVRLGSDAATQALALATETKARLDTLQNAHDVHKHTGVTTGGGVSAVSDTLVGPLAAIASSKVVTDG